MVQSPPQLNQTLPQNEDAERALLGAILVDSRALLTVQDFLRTEHFYSQKHQLLYKLMNEIFENEHACDLPLVLAEIRRLRREDILPPGYVAGLEQFVTTTVNVAQYARIIVDKARLRQLILAAQQIHEMAQGEEQPAEDLLHHSEKLIFDIMQERKEGGFQELKKLSVTVMEDIERRFTNKEDGIITGVQTHYKRLDSKTGGLQPSDFIIIAGRPSSGKTAFALNLALNIIWKSKEPVGFFSLEMSAEQLVQRLLACYSKVSSEKLRSGYLKAEEQRKVIEGNKVLSNFPLYIDDTPGLNILEIRARARRLKSRVPNLSVIFIDYLQLIQGPGGSQRGEFNRQQEVSEISRTMKNIARELKVPVIALSQLSRLIERRKGKDSEPKLSDLRESGALEQDADVILFVHRDMSEQRAMEGDPVKQRRGLHSDLIIGKQRNGPLDTIPLLFFPDLTSFQDPPKDYERQYDV